MRIRLIFGSTLLAGAVVLTGCGGGSTSSSAASDQAAAIASAEAQAAKQTPAPSSDDSSDAPSSDVSSTDAPSSDSPSPAESSASAGATTCADQTINGRKITDVVLSGGGTCEQLAKVAASPQIGGETFEWAVDGFHCAAGTDTMYVCDLDNADAEIDFTATAQ